MFRAKVNKDRLRDTIAFLAELLSAEAEDDESGLVVDQDQARRAIATCLDLKDPRSPMKDEMYNSFTLHATNLAVEGVCLRTNKENRRIEVLLQRRSDDDYWYKGRMAGLGQVLRVTDSGPEAALERLTATEFKVPTRYEFLDDVYVVNGRRGWFVCKVHLAFPERESAIGEWYPADPLPPETNEFRMVPAHREKIIPLALGGYKERLNHGFNSLVNGDG